MRLIGSVESEKQAFVLYSYLLTEEIHSTYEQQGDAVSIWVYEEEQVGRATMILEEFKANPQDPKFAQVEFPKAPPQSPDLIAEPEEEKKEELPTKENLWKARARQSRARSYPFTSFIILVCAVLYFMTSIQYGSLVKKSGELAKGLGFVPIQQVLMFDYPQSQQKVDELLKTTSLKGYKTPKEIPQSEQAAIVAAQNLPTWRGGMAFLVNWMKKQPDTKAIDGPMFTQIREGQAWRLFTPCLLHAGFLHILFNMAWAWILLRQVEDRLPIWKILTLIVFIGVIANIAQYLVSGSHFLGFSGVVCGLIGFIWVRQKTAPWEGYPLQKSAIVFIFIYVTAMFGLEIFSVVRQVFSGDQASAQIANTAHIIGGLCGALLGRFPFFARGLKK